MKNIITIKVPNEYIYFSIVQNTLKDLSKRIGFTKQDKDEILKASKEIFNNAVEHAYLRGDGFIEVDIHMFKCGMRIDIRDWGIPISKSTPQKIIHTKKSGFSKAHKLVNNFRYYNLGKDGKKFSLIKHKSKCSLESELFNEDKKVKNVDHSNTEIVVRGFKKGDEEGISKLIYENYKHSYAKEIFYYPAEILKSEGKKYHSIVAYDKDSKSLVGHFALIMMDDSNIAEIGIVVVSPQYKGLGIMNKMFDALINKAKELKLDAIFGEAVMYHSFSQKSNLSHQFVETALEFGKYPADIQIENNEASNLQKRGSVLVGYKLFTNQNKTIYLPKLYSKQIKEVYDNCSQINYKVETKKDKKGKTTKISNIFNPLFNISTVVIDGYGKDFDEKFKNIFIQLQMKHCEVILAHINLEDIGFDIEKVVNSLKQRGFFYSGVLPLFHNNKDYLQLQFHNTEHITHKNVVCYSKFCNNLFKFIKKDKVS